MNKLAILPRMLSLSKLYLFHPKKGAEAARREENFIPSLWIYIAFLAGSLFFYWLKPWDFPDANAAFPTETLSLMFWFKVMLWQPPLELAWIVFVMGLVIWLEHGSLAVKLVSAVAWVAAPFILMVAYAQSQAFPKWAFAALSTLWLALFYPLLRKPAAANWKPLIGFMLGTNAIGFVLLLPMEAAVIWRLADFFYFLQILGGIWILLIGTLGLKALTGLRLPRAFMAVLLSLFFQIAIAFTFHLLGIVPKEILKALLYA